MFPFWRRASSAASGRVFVLDGLRKGLFLMVLLKVAILCRGHPKPLLDGFASHQVLVMDTMA